MSKLINVRQARKILKKGSDGAVYDLVARGIIPPGPLVRLGWRIQFNEEKLIEWIEKGGTAATNNEAQKSDSSLPATV